MTTSKEERRRAQGQQELAAQEATRIASNDANVRRVVAELASHLARGTTNDPKEETTVPTTQPTNDDQASVRALHFMRDSLGQPPPATPHPNDDAASSEVTAALSRMRSATGVSLSTDQK